MSSYEFLEQFIDLEQDKKTTNAFYLQPKLSPHVKIYPDRLRVKYTGTGSTQNDLACIQTNRPIPRTKAVFYFETEILDTGTRGQITVGFTDREFQPTKFPGASERSYGYKADGKIFHQGTHGEVYGPKFGVTDVFGCGINFVKKRIFFTLNGRLIGSPYSSIPPDDYYPTISMHSSNEELRVNFGQKEPFKFDIEAFAMQQKREQADQILSSSLPVQDINELVQQYLYLQGYQETLRAFETATGSEKRLSGKPKPARLRHLSGISRRRMTEDMSVKLSGGSNIMMTPTKEGTPSRRAQRSMSDLGSGQTESAELLKSNKKTLPKEEAEKVDGDSSTQKETDEEERMNSTEEESSKNEDPEGNPDSTEEETNGPSGEDQNGGSKVKPSLDEEIENVVERVLQTVVEENLGSEDLKATGASTNNGNGHSGDNGEDCLQDGGNEATNEEDLEPISYERTESFKIEFENGTAAVPVLEEDDSQFDTFELMDDVEKVEWSHESEEQQKQSLEQELTSDDPSLLEKRSYMRQLIIDGDIDTAIKFIENQFPDLLQKDIEVRAAIYSQRFVELVRVGSIYGAVLFAQEKLSALSEQTVAHRKVNGKTHPVNPKDILGLLCYKELEESELNYVLSYEQRDAIADVINDAILRSQKIKSSSGLEKLVSHLYMIQKNLLEDLTGASAAKFELDLFPNSEMVFPKSENSEKFQECEDQIRVKQIEAKKEPLLEQIINWGWC